MSSITALKYYRTLKESKIPEDEAYAQACAFDAALVDLATKDDLKELVTKNDLQIVVHDLNSKVDNLEARINSKFDAFESKINSKIDTIRTLGWGAFAVIVMMLGVIMKMGSVLR